MQQDLVVPEMLSEYISAYNLVTTADSTLMSEHTPNLLMGIWCTYQNVSNPILEKHFVNVVSPWSTDSEVGHTAQITVNQIIENLLNELVPILNGLHSTEFTRRSWEIIVGPWLTQFVGYIFRRSSTLKRVTDSCEITSMIHYEKDSEYIAANATSDFRQKSQDPIWQSMVDGLLSTYLYQDRFQHERISLPVSGFKSLQAAESRNSLKGKIAHLISRVISSRALNSKSNKYYLQTTYLPYLTEIRLHLLLRQLPKIRWISTLQALEKVPLNINLRSSLRDALPVNNPDEIQLSVIRALPDLFPKCFLEGFQDLVEKCFSSNFPAKPVAIFTSNSFEEDEVFKVWTALQIQNGTSYIVGQHGNNYGTLKDFLLTEQRTADAFLTWGWSDGRSNTIPAFNLKSSGRRTYKTRGQGIVLIQDMLWYPTYPRDTDSEFAYYLENQFKFVSLLPEEIRAKLIIRLHHTSSNRPFDIVDAWKKFLRSYPEVKIDLGYSSLKKLIRSSALIVHGYDSTGMLETLSQDIPSVAFIPGGLHQLNDDALVRYQNLIDAGIVYTNAESAVVGISEIMQDLTSWRRNERLIRARIDFVTYYSRISKRPARELATLLKNLQD